MTARYLATQSCSEEIENGWRYGCCSRHHDPHSSAKRLLQWRVSVLTSGDFQVVHLLEQELYLHFVEDEFVPYAVLPDDTLLHFSVFPVHSKVQQPFLEGCFGSALNLVTTFFMTPLQRKNSGSALLMLKAERSGGRCAAHHSQTLS